MAYEKTNWVNGETPINAENLNKMEQGIEDAAKTGGILEGTIVAYDGDTIPEGYEEVDNPNVYSEEEKLIGEWIDGKPLYRKVVDVGNMPNNTTKQISGVSDVNVKKMYGQVSLGSAIFPLPYVNVDNLNYCIQLFANTGMISIKTKSDFFVDYTGYVVVEYTKN